MRKDDLIPLFSCMMFYSVLHAHTRVCHPCLHTLFACIMLCVSLIDTSIHTRSCSWNSQSHDLQRESWKVSWLNTSSLLNPTWLPSRLQLTLPQTKSHRPFVPKRLQSEQWARAVMTSITRRKLDQTSGLFDLVTCRNTQRWRHSHRYASDLHTDWQYEHVHNNFVLISVLSFHFSYRCLSWKQYSKGGKKRYKIKAWVCN